MKIDRVTFTGADNSVKPDEIFRVAEEHPHIKTEWALLLSKGNEGKCTRYPSLAWMEDFVREAAAYGKVLLAGHIQGIWLRSMCEGWWVFPKDRPTLFPHFQRIQLNFHGLLHHGEDLFYAELAKPYQFIFQMDGMNEPLYHEAFKRNNNVVPLFDTSAGAGIVPDSWPKPIHPNFNGYAGGLGPETIKEQLKKIEQVVGDSVIWVDMESGIRSNNDKLFDLNKCRRVLDVVTEITT